MSNLLNQYPFLLISEVLFLYSQLISKYFLKCHLFPEELILCKLPSGCPPACSVGLTFPLSPEPPHFSPPLPLPAQVPASLVLALIIALLPRLSVPSAFLTSSPSGSQSDPFKRSFISQPPLLLLTQSKACGTLHGLTPPSHLLCPSTNFPFPCSHFFGNIASLLFAVCSAQTLSPR